MGDVDPLVPLVCIVTRNIVSLSARMRFWIVISSARAGAGAQGDGKEKTSHVPCPFSSVHWLDFGEGPRSVEDLRLRPVKFTVYLPPLDERKAIHAPVPAAAQMHGHAAVLVACPADGIDDIGAEGVWRK